MGCFSFMCNVCGKPINSTSFNGEAVRLSLLDKGKVIEEMQGQYDSYGRVFDKHGESIEWKLDWQKVCDLMFRHKESGMSATHVECIGKTYTPEVSDSDPDQGWGKLKRSHMKQCEIYHKVFDNV